jgi:hypothetical protein
MWIVNMRQRRQVDLKDVVAVPVSEGAQISMIAVAEGIDDFLRFGLFGLGSVVFCKRGVAGLVSLSAGDFGRLLFSVQFPKLLLQILKAHSLAP